MDVHEQIILWLFFDLCPAWYDSDKNAPYVFLSFI